MEQEWRTKRHHLESRERNKIARIAEERCGKMAVK